MPSIISDITSSVKSSVDSLLGSLVAIAPPANANVVFWLDGADESTQTINGSNVLTQWVDKSSNAIPVSGGSAGPIATDNVYGSKLAFNFSGGKRMTAESSVLRGLSAVTVFAVVRPLNDSVAQSGGSVTSFGEVLQVGNWSTQSVDFGGLFPGYTVPNSIKNISAVANTAAVGSSQLQFGWLEEGHNRDVLALYETSSAGTKIFRGDQEVNATSFAGTGSAASDLSPSNVGVSVNNITIGGVRNGASVFGRLNGYLAEIIVYDRVLTASEKYQLKRYAEIKWGVQAQVPALHVIQWGQSNKVVTGVLKSSAPAEFTSPTFGSYVSVNGAFVHDLDTNISLPSTTEYGTEQRLARNLYSRIGVPVIVSKHAVVGTEVSTWTGPSGGNYTTLANRVTDILNDMSGFGFRVQDTLMDIQIGESDGLNESLANNFDTNLSAAINYWRDTYGLGDSMTVIINEIPHDATTITFRDTINEKIGITAANDPKGWVIGTINGTTSDGVHWAQAFVNNPLPIAGASAYINQQDTVAEA